MPQQSTAAKLSKLVMYVAKTDALVKPVVTFKQIRLLDETPPGLLVWR